MVGTLIRKKSSAVSDATPVSELGEDTELDKEAFSLILSKIDQGLRALPATAQVYLVSPPSATLLSVQVLSPDWHPRGPRSLLPVWSSSTPMYTLQPSAC